MKPLLATLTPTQKETLFAWCEEISYIEASKRAHAELALKISPSSLCRLCTTHRVEQDRESRDELLSVSGFDQSAIRNPQSALLNLASDQLHLRLVELASRPNPSATELRALFQIINRLEALKLSERRVAVSEKREARMQTKANDEKAEREKENAPKPSLPVAEVRRRVRALFGKPPLPEDEERSTECEPTPTNKSLNGTPPKSDADQQNPQPHQSRPSYASYSIPPK